MKRRYHVSALDGFGFEAADTPLLGALGALIGTEREMPRSGTIPGGASGFGGIRSYALLALL